MCRSCTTCFQPMNGIMDYAVREICEPCGGKAKVDRKAESEAIKRKWRNQRVRLPTPPGGRAA